MKGKPMKAFKAWAIIWTDGEVVSLHMNRDLACYSCGGDERCVPVEVRPLPKKKPAAKRAIPKPGRKMSHAEAQDHADKRYGKAFRKLAQTDTKRKGK